MQTDYVRSFSESGAVTQGHARNIVEFFMHATRDEARSSEAGREIFRDQEMIRIIVPGDMKNIVERIARDEDRVQYPREYDAFKRQEQLAIDGTPLEAWLALGRGVVRQLKSANVLTVEHLANLSDSQMSDIGILGLRSLRSKAQAALEMAESGSVPTRLVDEIDALKRDNAQMAQALEAANHRFEALLREKGADPTKFEATAVGDNPKPDVAPKTTSAPKVPENWKTLGNSDLFKLVFTLTGNKVSKRADAEEVILEILEG